LIILEKSKMDKMYAAGWENAGKEVYMQKDVEGAELKNADDKNKQLTEEF
jgi:hypothetical protein